MVLAQDIAGTYSVVSFGQPNDFSGVKITFRASGLRTVSMNARVVNIINGSLKLKGSTLKGALISTMMWGPDHLMELESFLGEGTDAGITVTKTSTGLTLTYGGKELALKKE